MSSAPSLSAYRGELPTTTKHPLSPLTADEVFDARRILTEAGLVGPRTRFSYVMLREPDKGEVLHFNGLDAPAREVWALLTDLGTGCVTETVTDLSAGVVSLSRDIDTAHEGCGPLLDEDLALCDKIVKSDPAWIAAIERRGVRDLSTIIALPATAGVFGYGDEVGRRVYRVLAFHRNDSGDIFWSNPVSGVVAHVAIDTGEVLRVVETPVTHIPAESGNYFDETVSGPMRTSLRPIAITQPEGRSFTLTDNVLDWERWRVRIGYNGREGLTLHEVSFLDGETRRPIMYRGSISEMVVNYGDPTPIHAWQNYFDVGEFQFGRLANSLKLGCDCLGDIQYVDALIADDFGTPQTIPQAICIHEEDAGILWKHTDDFAGTADTRRQRRLVVSFFVTVGNYDYGFYWYFYLDGTIELEAKATGIVFTTGIDETDHEFSTQMASGLGAPVHQHHFGARLDMIVDGVANNVDEIDVEAVPITPENPWGNAFTRRHTPLRTELGARRSANGALGRTWRISSADRVNRFGDPTSYVLFPEGKPTLLSARESSIRARAEFAAHHLWVTRYSRDELWAAGYTVNQHPGGAGLPAYASANRSIENEDLVLWHTFSLTHFPRTEDWPVMPVDVAGFVLKPDGFFDRNPTLDVPASLRAECSTHTDAGSACTPPPKG